MVTKDLTAGEGVDFGEFGAAPADASARRGAGLVALQHGHHRPTAGRALAGKLESRKEQPRQK